MLTKSEEQIYDLWSRSIQKPRILSGVYDSRSSQKFTVHDRFHLYKATIYDRLVRVYDLLHCDLWCSTVIFYDLWKRTHIPNILRPSHFSNSMKNSKKDVFWFRNLFKNYGFFCLFWFPKALLLIYSWHQWIWRNVPNIPRPSHFSNSMKSSEKTFFGSETCSKTTTFSVFFGFSKLYY